MSNFSPNQKFKKRFGQNFFKSSKWPRKLAEIAGIESTDTVLEIGPGDGAVTEILLQKARKVVSLEIDSELISKLQKRFAAAKNFTLLNQDILQTNLDSLKLENYKVVGSLPYNIAKKIIRIFLAQGSKILTMTVVVQKEVAEDYVAVAPNATFLSNLAKIYADVQLKGSIPQNDFYPEPKVKGAILYFTNINPKFSDDVSLTNAAEKLLKFIKVGFKSPRKTVANNLQSLYQNKEQIIKLLEKRGLTATARASELELPLWNELLQASNFNSHD